MVFELRRIIPGLNLGYLVERPSQPASQPAANSVVNPANPSSYTLNPNDPLNLVASLRPSFSFRNLAIFGAISALGMAAFNPENPSSYNPSIEEAIQDIRNNSTPRLNYTFEKWWTRVHALEALSRIINQEFAATNSSSSPYNPQTHPAFEALLALARVETPEVRTDVSIHLELWFNDITDGTMRDQVISRLAELSPGASPKFLDLLDKLRGVHEVGFDPSEVDQLQHLALQQHPSPERPSQNPEVPGSNNPERTLLHPENPERSGRGHGSGSTEIRNEVEHPVDAILRGVEHGFEHGAEDITRRR